MDQNVTVSNQQIRQAAKSGVELLNDKDLRVPGRMAMSGDLVVLSNMLASIVSGQCVLVNAQERAPTPTPPDGDDGESLKEPEGEGLRAVGKEYPH